MSSDNPYSRQQANVMYYALQDQLHRAIEDTYTQADIDLLLSDYSLTNHNHDGTYSPTAHNHDAAYSALGHLHDGRYYTEQEVDTALGYYSLATHNHNTAYYTKSQVDALLAIAAPAGMLVYWWMSSAPSGWALANGSALTTNCAYRSNLISQSYPFGQSGSDPLLQNVQNRVVVGAGTRTNGQTGGAEEHTLSKSEMPSHSHEASMYGGSGSSEQIMHTGGGDGSTYDGYIASTGGGQPHNNMQPYFVLTPIVYLGEIY